MGEGRSGSGGHSGSSTSSHSSSSSSSSRNRDTRLLISISPSVSTERIHTFFDRSLDQAKPPIGPGFVKKVSRKSDGSVVVSIGDSSIARRLHSIFSQFRPKIDGHECSLEFYNSEQSKSKSSPTNGERRRDKASSRVKESGCQPSSSSSSNRIKPSISSPSTSSSSSRPSTSTHDSTRIDCAPSSSTSAMATDPYDGIVGVSIERLRDVCPSHIKDLLREGLRAVGLSYLSHSEESGRIAVLLRAHAPEKVEEETLNVQGHQKTFTPLSQDQTRKLYDAYLATHSSSSSMDSLPSTSSSSSCPRRPSDRDALSYESSRTIFLPCLEKGVNRDWIRKRFHKQGTVLESDIRNGSSVSPHAIVQFSHTQAAVNAMVDYEREQREEEERGNTLRNKKHPSFTRSPPSSRIWVANLPPHDEDYVKKKLHDVIKGAASSTIVTDLRRREAIIQLPNQEEAKNYLEIFKNSPLVQQGGAVQTWLVADYCSDKLYDYFIERRGISPSATEVEHINTLTKTHLSSERKSEAEGRLERMKGGEEQVEKKMSVNGENGDSSPSSSRRQNCEDRRSGDSGFGDDREKGQGEGTGGVLDSDDEEMLDRKWRTVTTSDNGREEKGILRGRVIGMAEKMESFINGIPEAPPKVKKEKKEEGETEEEEEKKENEKMTRDERVNYFKNALLSVSTPLKPRSMDERWKGKDPLRSPPIPISPLNGDKVKKHIVTSPPSGTRPAPLHITIPPSTSTTLASQPNPSPGTRGVPHGSTPCSSRHPSISTPTLTPRSHTMPSVVSRPPHLPSTTEGGGEGRGSEGRGGGGENHPSTSGTTSAVGTPVIGTPVSSRHPLSRRESVSSNSSQSHTPLPLPTGSTPTTLKSPPIQTWSSSVNAWKGGPSLSSPSPLPSSINRSRTSIDHHKPSTPSSARPPLGLPKPMDKPGFGMSSSSSSQKIPSLPRSSSMSEKKPSISRDSSKDIVNNIIANKSGLDMKKMQRIPKKENKERDERDERKEREREERKEKKREGKEKDREERKEKKEDRKNRRENETKEEKTKRKELKKKEREKEERKKSTNDKEKKRKSIDGGEKKKKKKQKRTSSDSESDSDSDRSVGYKQSSSAMKQLMSDEALARALGSSMYDRVKGRRSGTNKEEKKKNEALEAIRKKNNKSTKRVHLSSSSDSEGVNESVKKWKKDEDESSEEEEKERKKEKKKEKKREKERRETSEESESEEERNKEKERREEKKRKKKEEKGEKEEKVWKKSTTLDLFSDDNESVKSAKSEKKEKLAKKRSHEKDDKDVMSPSRAPPPDKKVKKEESSSSSSESEGERSSKKSEVSSNGWKERERERERGREMRDEMRLSESSGHTHSEKDFGRSDEAWKSPASGSTEKEIKEEPKEEQQRPRLLTKAAMKEFNVGASSSPLAGSSWINRGDDGGLNLSSDSSQSSSDSEEEKEEKVERREEERDEREDREERREEEMIERREEEEENEEEEERIEAVKEKEEEEERIEEPEEEKIEEEEKLDEVKDEEEKEEEEEEEEMEESSQSIIHNDEEAESAVRGLEIPSDDAIEETEKAVESIFDEEEEPDANYPSNDFLHQIQSHDMNLSSSSSQCSSPKIVPSSSTPSLPPSLPPPLSTLPSLPPLRPSPLYPSSHPSISSPSHLSPHLLHSIPSTSSHPFSSQHSISHIIPPSLSSPLISPHPPIISPTIRNQPIPFLARPISQDSSSQHGHDDNGGPIYQENISGGRSHSGSDGQPSPSPHPTVALNEIISRLPLKWSGKMMMKSHVMVTRWHKLHGDDAMIDQVLPHSENIIRVTGKMKLDNERVQELVTSLDDHACLIAFPAGADVVELNGSREVFKEGFVKYLNNKMIAGISEFKVDGDVFIAHMFAPGHFTSNYLNPKYPDLSDGLSRRFPNEFLLVLLKRKDE